jgi:hypothetical protein
VAGWAFEYGSASLFQGPIARAANGVDFSWLASIVFSGLGYWWLARSEPHLVNARAPAPGDHTVAAALEDWTRAVGEHGISQAVLIARDNDTRAALNTAARDHVHAQGQLRDDVDYGRVTVAVGDRIICRRN